MKDLDFDELDRAVNSLMTNVSKTEPPKDEDHIKTLDITSTLAPGAVPEFSKLAASSPSPVPAMPTPLDVNGPPAVAPSPPPRSAAPSLAARRGGRFMDVVHPSSDMKPRPAPASPQSRQGITITPTQPDALAASAEPVAKTPAPVSQSIPEVPASPQPVANSAPTSPVNEWPDPLDMVNFDEGAQPKKAAEPVKPATATLEEPPAKAAESPAKKDDTEAPLTTPFLAGTKVEKRPLGGSTLPVSDDLGRTPVLSSDSLNLGTVNDPDDQLPALPKDVEPILPAELQRDLMAIEADTSIAHAPEEAQPAIEVEGKVSKEDMEPSSKPTASAAAPKSEPPVMSGGPTSIPQQYREEPSTGETTSGAIYDTDTYHQPLSHPAKKKSGWLWVVWIILIVLVGAGIGAALFFFGVV